jgi:hypothetical protein
MIANSVIKNPGAVRGLAASGLLFIAVGGQQPFLACRLSFWRILGWHRKNMVKN